MRSKLWLLGSLIGLALWTSGVPALAQDAAPAADAEPTVSAAPAAPSFDTGDTAWMMTSTLLVLMMTVPALALFYGGLVRSKNVLSTLMHSLFCAALISVTWVLFGYSLAFGPDKGGFIGDFSLVCLGWLGDSKGIMGTSHPAAATIPQIVWVVFQMTFAIITPALISGTFAERMRFPAFALFMLLWSTFIYLPLCHWVWGGGWIATQIGALDFAGGTVVHISSGISALVTALYLGKRLGYGHESMAPHNLPFAVIGAALLWVGWFGFNAGSAAGSNELAALAFINTNTAAAAAALSWMFAEWIKAGKPTILGAASGVVAGLVAITPAAGFVTPTASILIGLLAGVVCYAAVSLKPKFGYDDALDVVGVHFVGGTLGAIATGIFACTAVNGAIPGLALMASDAAGGALYGHPELVWKQILAVLATYAFCGLGTLIILTVVNAIFKIRATQEEEMPGLDISQHSERAYHIGTGEFYAVVGSRDPRPASIPPISWDRFTIALEGVDQNAMLTHWRSLCQSTGTAPTPQFKTVYSNVSTIKGNKFRFRGGDPEKTRQSLESLFKPVAPSARATVEKVEERAKEAALR